MYIENLCIEITRKCNMRCAHCLRGNAQNINIEQRHISEMLSHCKDGIGSLTLTGGEPTLNLDAIEFIFQTIKWLDIPLGSFYIVTNGRVFRQRLVDVLDDIYNYCFEKEMCGLAISDDEFHSQYQSPKFTSILYNYKYNEYDMEREYFRPLDKKTQFYRGGLINEGRAKELTSYQKRENTPSTYLSDMVHVYADNNIGGTLYLNALGDLIDGCDWSYESQNQRRIASIFEWKKFLKAIPRDNS